MRVKIIPGHMDKATKIEAITEFLNISKFLS